MVLFSNRVARVEMMQKILQPRGKHKENVIEMLARVTRVRFVYRGRTRVYGLI